MRRGRPRARHRHRRSCCRRRRQVQPGQAVADHIRRYRLPFVAAWHNARRTMAPAATMPHRLTPSGQETSCCCSTITPIIRAVTLPATVLRTPESIDRCQTCRAATERRVEDDRIREGLAGSEVRSAGYDGPRIRHHRRRTGCRCRDRHDHPGRAIAEHVQRYRQQPLSPPRPKGQTTRTAAARTAAVSADLAQSVQPEHWP